MIIWKLKIVQTEKRQLPIGEHIENIPQGENRVVDKRLLNSIKYVK